MDASAARSLATVRRLYQSLGRADLPAIALELTTDAAISFSGASARVPWHSGAQGVNEVPEFLRLLSQHLEFEHFEFLSEIASAEHVACLIHVRYRVKATGRVVDQRQVHWLTLANDKVTSLTHFEDSAQVIEAAVGPRSAALDASLPSASGPVRSG